MNKYTFSRDHSDQEAFIYLVKSDTLKRKQFHSGLDPVRRNTYMREANSFLLDYLLFEK